MDIANGLLLGFDNILSLQNISFAFIGCFLGTLIGVLPGLGPASTAVILLPLVISVDPTPGIILLLAIYCGAMYGGSTTSILMNIPGEVASVVTTLDGYQLTLKGKAGLALSIAAIGSFLAATIGIVILTITGPYLANFALKFGPPEYFGLILFSMTAVSGLSGDSLLKGVASALLGFTLGMVGFDDLSGQMRLTFGSVTLMGGLEVVPVLIGLFGIGEVLSCSREGIASIFDGTIGKIYPTLKELGKSMGAILRGSGLGFVLGLLPGMLPAVTSFMAYDIEKRISKEPWKFGTGMIEGVAAPESANNSTSIAGMIPLMAFGIPTSATMAVILAALMIHGLRPGPLLFIQQREFVWTIIASLYLGNVMLLMLNLPLINLWVRFTRVPYRILAPVIIVVTIIGAYSPRNSIFDIWTALIFGLIGYIMRRVKWPLVPLILGFILESGLEQAFRGTLAMSDGQLSIFFDRPIALTFVLATAGMILLTVYIKRKKPVVAKISEDK